MKRRGLLAFSACLAAPSIVRAQKPYPNAPVTIVVGLSPGGSVDATIRFMAREASEQFGIQVVVENRPGGAQTIAPARVAHAAKDGYTLIAVTYTPYTTAPFFQTLPYNVDKDFTFIGQYATVLYPNYVMSESPIKTWADALEYAKSKPETLKWASATPLSPQQAANEAAFKMLGLKTIFVPFKGGGRGADLDDGRTRRHDRHGGLRPDAVGRACSPAVGAGPDPGAGHGEHPVLRRAWISVQSQNGIRPGRAGQSTDGSRSGLDAVPSKAFGIRRVAETAGHLQFRP